MPIFPALQEFIKRNGQFTVNVGLCEKGVPVLGVVGVPAADQPRTYFAVKDAGAFVEVWASVLFVVVRRRVRSPFKAFQEVPPKFVGRCPRAFALFLL